MRTTRPPTGTRRPPVVIRRPPTGIRQPPGLTRITGSRPGFPTRRVLPGVTRIRPHSRHWHWNRYRHHQWVGFWGGAWLGRWDSYWERRWLRRYPVLLGFGVSWWDINLAGYQFGCVDYYNPYAGEPIIVAGGAIIDYSQPIVQPPEGDAQQQESQSFAMARQAFLEGNYQLALSDVNAALKDAPQDAVLHQFRSLVLFAMADYKGAAAGLNAVLAAGPGWDWKAIRSLYPDKDTYTAHLRTLEKHVTDNPKDAAGHFVLGYHYVAMGHLSYALTEFKDSAALNPRDGVSKQMVTMLSKGESADDPNEADKEPPLPGSTRTVAAIPIEKMTGTWTAKRGGETFHLVMTPDDHFTWTHTDAKGKKTVLKGTYGLKDNTLALQPASGSVLLANIAMSGDTSMSFRMVNEDDADSGLTFTK